MLDHSLSDLNNYLNKYHSKSLALKLRVFPIHIIYDDPKIAAYMFVNKCISNYF